MNTPADPPGPGQEPQPLVEDLRRLYAADPAVPAELDQAIRASARLHFKRMLWRRRAGRWAGFGAAAGVMLALLWSRPWNATREDGSDVPPGTLAVARPEDIDRNGRVDILDAFTLARGMESATTLSLEWDVNGDGRIDGADVDAVARAAVRLERG